MIVTVAEIRIEGEKEHVVNLQKHSNHVDHYVFNLIVSLNITIDFIVQFLVA
jgi:hypothetical protein